MLNSNPNNTIIFPYAMGARNYLCGLPDYAILPTEQQGALYWTTIQERVINIDATLTWEYRKK